MPRRDISGGRDPRRGPLAQHQQRAPGHLEAAWEQARLDAARHRERRTGSSCNKWDLRSESVRSEPHQDVIIVGAGLSGLVAADVLSRAHLTVGVLEARDRIGGEPCPVRRQSRPCELLVVAMMLIPTLVALPALAGAVQRIGAAQVSLLASTDPLWAVLFATAFLSQVLSGAQVISGLLILVGAAFAQGRPNPAP
ncbi:EamA family transporter [Deinococcus hohokamensis]|uniref:EamA family transporter n=1 Tax=Deinococcus hohokamensis TaxID=309883 RepID=A0ABV9IEW9_9DEIO